MQGVILTLSAKREVVHRKPCWPWPRPDEYPKHFPNGSVQVFFPKPYYNFSLGDVINEHPEAPRTNHL